MKKIFSIIIMSVLLCTFVAPQKVMADTMNADTFLQQHGVPDEIIAIMSENEKQQLTQYNDLEFAGCKTDTSAMETPNKVITRGTISSSRMSFTGYGFTYKEGSTKILYFSAHYDWQTEPYYYLGDQIGISWDSSIFEPIDGEQWVSCTYTDRYQPQLGEVIYPGLSFYNSYDKYDSSPSSVIFDVPMYPNSHSFGACTVRLRVKSGITAPSSTQLYYKYGHSRITWNPSLSISASASGASGGISFSSSSTCDHISDFQTLSCSW